MLKLFNDSKNFLCEQNIRRICKVRCVALLLVYYDFKIEMKAIK